MNFRKIGSICLLFGLTSLPLLAQEDQEQPRSERLKRLLQRFDKDGDGQLSDEERAAANAALQGQPGERRRGDREGAPEQGDGQPGRPEGRPGPGRPGFGLNPDQIFQQFDQNKDGKISKDELGERGQRFAQADANSDGEITKEELEGGLARLREQAARAFDPEQAFARMDQNGDGKLTKDELGERGQWALQADANSDGEVTKEELRAGAARIRDLGQGGFNPEQAFTRWDQNSDGKLTKEELADRPPWMLQADGNGDGEITKDELQAGLARMREQAARAFNPEQMFARMDQNGDGKLQKEELRGPFAERAAEIDADKDGEISKEEFREAPRRGLLGGGPGGASRPRSVDDMFAQYDKDTDGKLTKEELPERAAEFILRADGDGDGAVTKDELRASRERQGRGERRPGNRQRPPAEENKE